MSYDAGVTGIVSREHMINLTITDDAFQCDDGHGNGCGSMFDALIVAQVCGLCANCAEDLPEDEGC